ncbi:MAG: YdcF family protein [Cyanobacteria bacterium J06638_20]
MARRFKLLRWLLLSLLTLVFLWLATVGITLFRHSQQAPDAVLVLGGSITREIYVADRVALGESLPIVISRGSRPPCIRLLFERAAAPLDTTWLEDCAQSTFDNYRFSITILQQWQTHHVQVVTSASHLPRATWLARIMLGSHGIWPTMVRVPERGMPGNVETPVKTMLDVARSLAWAVVSQVHQSHCSVVIPLSSVDLAIWKREGFRCEHQGGLKVPTGQ